MSLISCVDPILLKMPAEFETRGKPMHNTASRLLINENTFENWNPNSVASAERKVQLLHQ